MGFRFRRTVRVAPGVRLNLSKSGAPVSVGGRGATVNVGRKGIRTTSSAPGTGLSYVSQTSFRGMGTGTPSGPPGSGIPPQRTQHADKWTSVKTICAFLVTTAILILVVDLASRGNRTSNQDAHAPVTPPSASASFTPPIASAPTPFVPPAPSVPPAKPDASAQPSPQASPPMGGNAAVSVDSSAVNTAALAATLERLRAERSRAEAAAEQSNPPQQQSLQSPQAPPDQTQVPPQPGPVPASQVWTHTTSAGTRWRLKPQGGDYVLFVDLGDGQVASIHVVPQFQNLDLGAMNLRVDWLKSQITQASYPVRSGSYQYARDGSIYPLP